MKTLYLDSSALVKLVVRERQSEALVALLAARPRVVSSALAKVEVLRSVARAGGRRRERDRAREVLKRTTLIAIDDPILEAAASLAVPDLRSLDAIHLATANLLRPELEALVSYDRRLNAAAKELGLPVVSPR